MLRRIPLAILGATTVLLGALSPAFAGEVGPDSIIICDPNTYAYAWSSKATPWAVLHQYTYEHFTNSTGTFTKTATAQTSVKASVSYTVGIKVSGQIPIASLSAETNLSLKSEGTQTNTASITLTETLDHYAVYVFYDGTHRATGSFSYNKCNSRGDGSTVVNKGTALSWDQPRSGALACDTTPPVGSLGATVKLLYC